MIESILIDIMFGLVGSDRDFKPYDLLMDFNLSIEDVFVETSGNSEHTKIEREQWEFLLKKRNVFNTYASKLKLDINNIDDCYDIYYKYVFALVVLLAYDSSIFSIQSHKIEASGHRPKRQTFPTHESEKILKEFYPELYKDLYPKDFVLSEHGDDEFFVRTFIERHFTDSIEKYPIVLKYYSKAKQLIKKIYNDLNGTELNVDEIEKKLSVLYDRSPIISVIINSLLDYPFTNQNELSLMSSLIIWTNTKRDFEYNIPGNNRSLVRKPDSYNGNYFDFFNFIKSNKYKSKQTYMIPAFVNANEDSIREILDTPDIALTSLKSRVEKIIISISTGNLDSDQIKFVSSRCGYEKSTITDLVKAIETQLKKESKI